MQLFLNYLLLVLSLVIVVLHDSREGHKVRVPKRFPKLCRKRTLRQERKKLFLPICFLS